MSLATTTLSQALGAHDADGYFTALTNVLAGSIVSVDAEIMRVITKGYIGRNPVQLQRGLEGTAAVAHASGATVTIGTASDFSNAPVTAVIVNTTHSRAASVITQDDRVDTAAAAIPIATVTY